jgi:hypothetical protein
LNVLVTIQVDSVLEIASEWYCCSYWDVDEDGSCCCCYCYWCFYCWRYCFVLLWERLQRL